jgi:hypothetical protein
MKKYNEYEENMKKIQRMAEKTHCQTVRSGQPVESCASGMPQTLQSSSSSIANSTQKCWNKHYIRYIHKLYIYMYIYVCVYIYIWGRLIVSPLQEKDQKPLQATPKSGHIKKMRPLRVSSFIVAVERPGSSVAPGVNATGPWPGSPATRRATFEGASSRIDGWIMVSMMING